MKQLIIGTFLVALALHSNSQTTGGNTGTAQSGKTSSQTKKPNYQVKGATQYHGSKDTTPGSPMGTGGAGGNEMSGSTKGSASESAMQSTKPDVQAAQPMASPGPAGKTVKTKSKATGNKSHPR